MMHPATELRFISNEKGFGVFAKRHIPAGTVVYVLDSLDLVIPPNDPRLTDTLYAAMLDHYCYNDELGNYILCWDHGRYMNHCCHPNTLTTGYGFEIALVDINPGDELTDDYGLLNIGSPLSLTCPRPDCRGIAAPDDLDRIQQQCDARIQAALRRFSQVPQDLLPLIPAEILASVYEYLSTGHNFRSVGVLKPQSA